MFMEIALSNNYNLLCHKCDDKEALILAWNEIVLANNKDSQEGELDNYFFAYQEMAQLMADYHVCRALLIKCYFIIDDNYIKFLRSKGIILDKTITYTDENGRVRTRESAKAYADSLERAMHGLVNYKAQINMKRNQLLEIANARKNGNDAPANFEQVIANLAFAIAPVQINDDIKLVRFNEYNRLLKQRNERLNKEAGHN